MSWYSKVVWAEGLFLRPQHLQQSDRYLEHLVEARTRYSTPYPWGFSHVEVDRDLAQQSRFGLRRAAGIMPDGTPFEVPADSPLPPAIEVPEAAARQLVWLTVPSRAANTREIESHTGDSASRYITGNETVIDSVSHLRSEEEIGVAHPRLGFEIGNAAKLGYVGLPIARIVEVSDRSVVFDEKYAPPLLVCAAHPTVQGWLDAVIGWINNKLEQLARYAADPTAGGGLQSSDYLMLQMLNRVTPVLTHLRRSRYVHPERLFEELLSIAGELATFAGGNRRAGEYPAYDHDDLANVFDPVLRDIQAFLSKTIDTRAIKLELIERGTNAYISTIQDRALFRSARFVLEVAARRPLSEIQSGIPRLLKVGPNNKMNEIVQAHLPGLSLVHLPTPPRQIRAMTGHVYFYLDPNSPLWQEFSVAAAIAFHFAGDWPDLELELWAVKEGRG